MHSRLASTFADTGTRSHAPFRCFIAAAVNGRAVPGDSTRPATLPTRPALHHRHHAGRPDDDVCNKIVALKVFSGEVQQMLTRVRAEVVAATKSKQVPWSNSSLLGEVFLAAKP
jgi:hypothetical protein